MDRTRYYRFESGNVILRRTGDRVEKFGHDGVWIYQPNLISRFTGGMDGLEEISAEAAERFVSERRRP